MLRGAVVPCGGKRTLLPRMPLCGAFTSGGHAPLPPLLAIKAVAASSHVAQGTTMQLAGVVNWIQRRARPSGLKRPLGGVVSPRLSKSMKSYWRFGRKRLLRSAMCALPDVSERRTRLTRSHRSPVGTRSPEAWNLAAVVTVTGGVLAGLMWLYNRSPLPEFLAHRKARALHLALAPSALSAKSAAAALASAPPLAPYGRPVLGNARAQCKGALQRNAIQRKGIWAPSATLEGGCCGRCGGRSAMLPADMRCHHCWQRAHVGGRAQQPRGAQGSAGQHGSKTAAHGLVSHGAG